MFIRRYIRKLCHWLFDKPSNTPPAWENTIKHGNNVHILNCHLDHCFAYLISVGDNVTITNATILAHDASTKNILGYSKVGRVDIGSNVFIGAGSIVLCNTRIGNNVIIGAGTVVAKDVPDNVVIAGNPWRVICSYGEYVERQKRLFKERPVYHTLFSDKSQEEKQMQFRELNDFQGGFDL